MGMTCCDGWVKVAGGESVSGGSTCGAVHVVQYRYRSTCGTDPGQSKMFTIADVTSLNGSKRSQCTIHVLADVLAVVCTQGYFRAKSRSRHVTV